ncbi:hypothetical protein MAR_025281 [Mya arenaria]|uniref:Uncharacterized protein n=1 Tax=Mya arenaria TaxID=6604 RepID=A0ABY7DV00_MYAAR|nr:hypothetical protein MAR_025281 [Mya arenaria]
MVTWKDVNNGKQSNFKFFWDGKQNEFGSLLPSRFPPLIAGAPEATSLGSWFQADAVRLSIDLGGGGGGDALLALHFFVDGKQNEFGSLLPSRFPPLIAGAPEATPLGSWFQADAVRLSIDLGGGGGGDALLELNTEWDTLVRTGNLSICIGRYVPYKFCADFFLDGKQNEFGSLLPSRFPPLIAGVPEATPLGSWFQADAVRLSIDLGGGGGGDALLARAPEATPLGSWFQADAVRLSIDLGGGGGGDALLARWLNCVDEHERRVMVHPVTSGPSRPNTTIPLESGNMYRRSYTTIPLASGNMYSECCWFLGRSYTTIRLLSGNMYSGGCWFLERSYTTIPLVSGNMYSEGCWFLGHSYTTIRLVSGNMYSECCWFLGRSYTTIPLVSGNMYSEGCWFLGQSYTTIPLVSGNIYSECCWFLGRSYTMMPLAFDDVPAALIICKSGSRTAIKEGRLYEQLPTQSPENTADPLSESCSVCTLPGSGACFGSKAGSGPWHEHNAHQGLCHWFDTHLDLLKQTPECSSSNEQFFTDSSLLNKMLLGRLSDTGYRLEYFPCVLLFVDL